MVCTACGATLNWSRKLLGRSTCADCARRIQRAEAEARTRYRQLAAAIADGTQPADAGIPLLLDAAKVAQLTASEKAQINLDAFTRYVERLLADDHLTDGETRELARVRESLGIDPAALHARFADLGRRIIIAQANAGTLPTLRSTQLICRRGEVVHAEVAAVLLKETKLREFRGGYSGFSFRVMKGVRYHVGATRGRSAVVGTKMVAVDTGVLAVSSQRLVFLGKAQTIDLPYGKVDSLHVFRDGIQFHVSNRQTAPLFKVESGDVIAAIINAAIQRVLD